MFFKKKKDINDDILSQIKAKISDESGTSGSQDNDLLGALMDTSDGVVMQNEATPQANDADESVDILNDMVADVISKSNQEQAEIEDIAEDDILDDLLDDTTNNAATAAATTQTSQLTESDDNLLGNLLDDAPAKATSDNSVDTKNATSSNSEMDDLLGDLLADEPQQTKSVPSAVSEVKQKPQIEEAENYDDLLGNLLDDNSASTKTEQEVAVKAEEDKFDSNSLLDNLISKVDDSVLEDKPVAKSADNIEETVTDQFVPLKQTMVHKDEVPEEVAVADDKYDAVSDDLLNSVIGTAKDEKLMEQEKEVPVSQIADKMDELLEAPKKEEKDNIAAPKAIVKIENKPQPALRASSKIEEGTKNGVKRSITELIENVKNQIICERETRTAQASSKTLEEVVGDLIQPKVVAFLNDNLERIVEDVVHREINKIIRGIDEEK